jgi:hypothetical protein
LVHIYEKHKKKKQQQQQQPPKINDQNKHKQITAAGIGRSSDFVVGTVILVGYDERSKKSVLSKFA